MRIGNGPRLAIPRPGSPGRRGWYGRYIDRGEAYDEWRALRLRTLRVMRRRAVAGDKKPEITILRNVPLGRWCRQVDDHGRCFGPRLQREADLPETTRVRIVQRQEEDLHSQISRMLKRAHRLSTRDNTTTP